MNTRVSRSRNQVVDDENQLSRKCVEKRKLPQADDSAGTKKRRTTFSDITNALNGVLIDSTKRGADKSSESQTKARKDSVESTRPSLLAPLVEEHLLKLSQGSSSSGSSDAGDLSADAGMESPPRVSLDSKGCIQGTGPETAYDRSVADDISQVALYAKDIFDYYRRRELKFKVDRQACIALQTAISPTMRMILVDWMVEVQENFELNHETLYLAVKIVNLVLCRQFVEKENLQLVGATALFIAAKFDERNPPVCDDFVYICDDAYNRNQVLQQEMRVLRILDFDLGIPLSYRFLRRYAKATHTTMELLTLARWVLETSLLFNEYVDERESKLAAAALLLALRMKGMAWSPEHAEYSEYGQAELEPLMWRLNRSISSNQTKTTVKTVLAKYSHSVFFEVAKTPPLPQPTGSA